MTLVSSPPLTYQTNVVESISLSGSFHPTTAAVRSSVVAGPMGLRVQSVMTGGLFSIVIVLDVTEFPVDSPSLAVQAR